MEDNQNIHQRFLYEQQLQAFQYPQAAAPPQPPPPPPQQQQQQQQQQPSEQPDSQQNKLPPYVQKLTVRDSNGVVKEMIFPKDLDLYRPKRARTTFSSDQLVRLEEAFRRNHYMVGRERNDLAKTLNLSETQVKVWFQNRRTKFKRDQGGAGPADEAAAARSEANGSPTGRPRSPTEWLKLSKPPTVSQLTQQGEAAAAAAAAAAYMYGMPWYRHASISSSSNSGPPFLMPQQSVLQTPRTPTSQQVNQPQHQLESAGGHFAFGQSSYSLAAPYSQMSSLFRPRAI